MIFLWYFYGVSIVFLLDSYRVSKGCLSGFHWIPVGFLWDFHDISFRFL